LSSAAALDDGLMPIGFCRLKAQEGRWGIMPEDFADPAFPSRGGWTRRRARRAKIDPWVAERQSTRNARAVSP